MCVFASTVSVTDLRDGKLRLFDDERCALSMGTGTGVDTNSTLCAGYAYGFVSGCEVGSVVVSQRLGEEWYKMQLNHTAHACVPFVCFPRKKSHVIVILMILLLSSSSSSSPPKPMFKNINVCHTCILEGI